MVGALSFLEDFYNFLKVRQIESSVQGLEVSKALVPVLNFIERRRILRFDS
jgi:hypothetical protein